MRIGPISLFTLICVLLLSVLAVLCVTSANAAATMSARQAAATAETYRLDACGQEAIAVVDETLRGMRPASATEVASAAAERLRANPGTLAGSDEDFAIDAQADGSRIDLTITAPGGKTLSAAIRVNDDSTYAVDEWEITGTQAESDETLWSGTADR